MAALMVLSLSAKTAAAQQTSETARKIREASGYIVAGERARALESLPAPPAALLLGENRPCAQTELRFSDDDAKSEWLLPAYTSMLNLWAILHTGARAGTSRPPSCADLEFSARLWQTALNAQPTGQLTRNQVLEFTRRIDANAPSFADSRREGVAAKDRGDAQQQAPVAAAGKGAAVPLTLTGRPFTLFGITIGSLVRLPQCDLSPSDIQVGRLPPRPAQSCRTQARVEWDAERARIGLLDTVYMFAKVGEAPSEGTFVILLGDASVFPSERGFIQGHQLGAVAVNGRIEGLVLSNASGSLVADFERQFGPPRTEAGSRGSRVLIFETGDLVARASCEFVGCSHVEVMSRRAEQYVRDLWARQEQAAHGTGGGSSGQLTPDERQLQQYRLDEAARQSQQAIDFIDDANQASEIQRQRAEEELLERQRAQEEAIQQGNEQRQRQIEQWEAEQQRR